MLPLFQQIKITADEILHMNQQNMSDANERARSSAAAAQKQMYFLLSIGAIVAVGFVFFTGQWILRPINYLAQSADEIRRGNLDLIVRSNSRDEIGHLSEAFNAMAASLRQFRRSNQAKLARMQRATQQAFGSLPEAVAVIDLEGKVEEATEAAENIFGLKANTSIHDLPSRPIVEAYEDALKGASAAKRESSGKIFQHFRGGEEGYFRPEAVPILGDDRQPTGVTLVIRDVTQLQQQDEIKRGVISTVSHQLKTPLTSIRMTIHLLLEEKIGPLTEKQAELLIASREDSDRLHSILNSLLDISRIESGKVRMECRALSPHSVVLDAVEPFHRAAQDQGVALAVDLPDDLPDVWADMTRIGHAFGNLLSNALKYTAAGGKVSVSAKADDEWVHFSISDTGRGIAAEYLRKVFEQFFRVPDQGAGTGAGLGLAIVKEIVEAHGGTVRVASDEGKGSTFTLSLRRADRVPKEESAS
jgi:PAS domain S-box-containing protein